MIERCGRFYSPEAEEKFGPRNPLLSKIISRGCSESAIRAFIQVGARDILDEERSALGRAVLRGDPRIVELLLDNGVTHPTRGGGHRLALSRGAMNMIQLFLMHGCQMRRVDMANRKGHYDVVELLIQEPRASACFRWICEENMELGFHSAISCAIIS